MSKYLSITEFAKKANLSRTTVYRKLETELSQYCVTENGKKLISETALQIVLQDERTENAVCDNSEQKCYTKCNSVTETSENVQKCPKVFTETEMLQNTVHFLKQQIEEKDKQINYLIDVLKVVTTPPKQKTNFFKRLFSGKQAKKDLNLLPG